ncbi:MAG TPA: AAA family ATPase [Candidatus Binataceae bacterium]|nr:AAA family ATPase [Candidatus Binataceae bacterium]
MAAGGAVQSREVQARPLPELVRAMLRPEFYPDPAARVELRQTHISYVFIAGDFVYKLKKPVRFAFLDCADLSRRYQLCCEEVRLNRRLAPDVYLGVYPILRGAAGLMLGEEARGPVPDAVEYAVKMVRLPEERMLDGLIRAGRADAKTIRAVAARIFDFHKQCSSQLGWTYGSAAAIWRLVVGNLTECDRFIGNTIESRQYIALEQYLGGFIAAHWEAINDRVRAHRVVEGHGDLRCEHIFVSDGGIKMIDCVEFSERLRYGDVASDLAFFAMDLDRLGARELADEAVDSYVAASGDDGLIEFVPFYKCYRAVVRAKVATLKSLEDEVEPGERDRARTAARNYFGLAYGYAASAAPATIVVCGKSATGKSTVARMLRYRTGFAVINSDRVRKRLAGIPADVHVHSAYDTGIYTEGFTQRTYETMIHEAEAMLREGRGVILDGTFKDPINRRSVMEAAARVGVPILFIECRADRNEIMRRLSERSKRLGEVSDADVEVFLQQEADFVPLTEIPARNYLVVDTAGGPGRVVLDAHEALKQFFESRRAVSGAV